MAISLSVAATSICQRLVQEHVNEGFPAPSVSWTGQKEIREDNRLWIEVKLDSGYGYITGWTDGAVNDGYINFIES